MIDLNDPVALATADPSDTLGAVEGTAEQWATAVTRARAASGLPSADGISDIVFCGMGGSGIAGDVLAAIAADRGSVPVTVVKGYTLPAHVGPSTLVIAASYSGNTEETLSTFDAAVERGARIVCLTTGGALARRAEAHGLACIAPVEGLQPRAALASLAAPTLIVCERLGLLEDLTADFIETEAVLAERTKSLGREASDNEAIQAARALENMVPLVWGQEGPLAVAAVRWRCQLNENAKILAFSNVLSELDHNELVGYHPDAPSLDRIALIVLRAPGEHPRNTLRIGATLEAVRPLVGSVREMWGTGTSTLARLMSTSILGDFTSVYLALGRGIDPAPVDVIENLKKRLA